ncbi:methyltransferase [Simiduia sp. 21SJ11W-1]|uniref:class I SAM-dependent methyltransferase n=1 Tax=Simiduia sp. 21SJ11W-1 TaxID=2909669 RepID=UPI00209C8CDD|nr:methyltransferase [Simiduia sp. 21SJ11W-1]UTA46574.1 methyltransferase [Simiduia sp. 21SJ11W-1]
MSKNVFKSCVAALLMACGPVAFATELEDVLKGEHRAEAAVARDSARNPAETLAFFGLEPTHTVVEVTPGGGWYTDILAPYVRDKGTLYAAHFPAKSDVGYYQRSRQKFLEKLAATPEVFDQVKVTEFVVETPSAMGPVGEVDQVLTFRNVHNWIKGGFGEQAFSAFYALLKDGGVLGVVEHRAKPGTSMETMKTSGYVTEAEVIRLAEAAGFVLESRSEINANPKDTAKHPKGVWTLPPTLALQDEDREKYLAIGESDRMTLKFRKPE